MAPSAPALLSTTSCWPIDCDTEFASTRVTMSVEEPAGNGTTTRTGLLGYCACAAKEIHRKAKPHRTCFMRLPPEPSALHRQHASGAMRGRKQKARSKREMIDERSELGLVCRPMRRPVEPEGEKHDIGCGQQRCFRKIGAGEEAHDESELEHRRDPSQNMGRGETRRRDGGRRCVDVRQLEAHRHNKERGKDQASYEDRCRRPSCPVRFRRHLPLLLIANLEALWVRRSSRLWMAVIACFQTYVERDRPGSTRPRAFFCWVKG